MKRSVKFFFVLNAACTLAACSGGSGEYSRQSGYVNEGNGTYALQESYDGETDYSAQRETKTHPGGRSNAVGVTDSRTGIPMWTIKLPRGWDFNYSLDYSKNADFPSTNWQAVHRNGVSARNIRSDYYYYSDNPQTREYLRMANMKVAAPQSAVQILRGPVADMMRQKGFQLTGQQPADDVAQRLRRSANAYGLHQARIEVVAGDWTGDDGRKARTIVSNLLLPNQADATWYYETTIMEGDRVFNEAANSLQQAIAQVEDNPNWIRHCKQVTARNQAAAQQQAASSWSAHQQRMRSNQAAFEATQRAISGANDAVNNSMMQTYRTQSQSMDRGQDQFVDYLRDEQNVYDPNSGNSYKVESGYDHYYVNGDNEYIGTNDHFYDPNMDPGVNEQEWYGTSPY